MRSLLLLCLFIFLRAGSLQAQSPTAQQQKVIYKGAAPIDSDKSLLDSSDIIALFALLVSMVSGVFTVWFASKANKANVLFGVFTEFRSPEFSEVRARVKEAISTNASVEYEPFRKYSYFLNHIGMLLHKGYVSTDEVYQMAGTNIIATWRLLSPHILEVRRQAKLLPKTSSHTPYFQFHFEYLAAMLLEHKEKGAEAIEYLMSESAEKIRIYSKPS